MAREVARDGHTDYIQPVEVLSGGSGSATTEMQYRNSSNALTTPSPTNPFPTTNAVIGTTTDAEATADGTLVAIQKRLRTLLGTLIAALPATLTSSGNLRTSIQETSTTGTQGNLWSAAAVSAAGTSTSTTFNFTSNVAIFGNSSAATNLTVQVSQDGTNWYNSSHVIAVAGAGNFYWGGVIAASRLRLSSSAAATITATAATKL